MRMGSVMSLSDGMSHVSPIILASGALAQGMNTINEFYAANAEVTAWNRGLSEEEIKEWNELTTYALKGGVSTYDYLQALLRRNEHWCMIERVHGLGDYDRYDPRWRDWDDE